MHPSIQALYADLAKALGVQELTPDANGSIQLQVGTDTTVLIVVEDPHAIMLISPVMELPLELDYGRALWLMRLNFYDSALAPFRVGCDKTGGITIWGHVPVDGLTGENLAGIIDAVATQADRIREEIEIDDSPADAV